MGPWTAATAVHNASSCCQQHMTSACGIVLKLSTTQLLDTTSMIPMCILNPAVALRFQLQSGLGLPTPPKGTIITLASAMDSQQVNPLYYKQTDETAKFVQVQWLHYADRTEHGA